MHFRTKKRYFLSVVTGVVILGIAVFLVTGNVKSGISYESFKEDMKVQTNIENVRLNVEKSSEKKDDNGKYTYILTDESTSESFEVKSTEDYQSAVIDGTKYYLMLSYKDEQEQCIDTLYETQLGKSYSDKEYEKFSKMDYSSEFEEYYQNYVE